MLKRLTTGVLLLLALSGCTYTGQDGKQQTLDLDLNHRIEFQREPSDQPFGEAVTTANADACSTLVTPDTLVLLHGDVIGSDVNARPAPDSRQWYDPPIMAKIGDSVRVLAKDGDWYQSRWVTPQKNVLVSYFHCSLILDPTQ